MLPLAGQEESLLFSHFRKVVAVSVWERKVPLFWLGSITDVFLFGVIEEWQAMRAPFASLFNSFFFFFNLPVLGLSCHMQDLLVESWRLLVAACGI